MRNALGQAGISRSAWVALRMKFLGMWFMVTHAATPQGTAIGIRARRIKLLAVMVSLNC